jgi:hypothetical protein
MSSREQGKLSGPPSGSIADYKGIHRGPVLLLGNGPSLAKLDPARVRIPMIGMHRSWRITRTYYHVILRQTCWWQEIRSGLWTPLGPIFHLGQPGPGAKYPYKVRVLGRVNRQSYIFSRDLSWGSRANNAGAFSIEIAKWMGFDPVRLIGYDMKDDRHFDGSPVADKGVQSRQRDMMQVVADALRGDTEIVNYGGEDSVLDMFTRGRLENVYHE